MKPRTRTVPRCAATFKPHPRPFEPPPTALASDWCAALYQIERGHLVALRRLLERQPGALPLLAPAIEASARLMVAASERRAA